MLEVCPTIADGPVSIKVNPLSMGDREDPARLVFTAKEGEGIATSLIDLGHRFRLIINKVDCKKTEKPMPELPVATAFWTPKPDLYKGAELIGLAYFNYKKKFLGRILLKIVVFAYSYLV